MIGNPEDRFSHNEAHMKSKFSHGASLDQRALEQSSLMGKLAANCLTEQEIKCVFDDN